MPAAITNFARTHKALEFLLDDSFFMGLSGVTAWADEQSPSPVLGTFEEKFTFFNECFIVRKITDTELVLPDNNAYDMTQLSSYRWLTVADASVFSVDDVVSNAPQGSGGAVGRVVKVLTGAAKVGRSEEICIDLESGIFFDGDSLYIGVNNVSSLIESPSIRQVHGSSIWKVIPDEDKSLLIIGTTTIAVGDIIVCTSTNSTARVISKIAINVGVNTFQYLVISGIIGSFTSTSEVKKNTIGATPFPVSEVLDRAYIEGVRHVRFICDFLANSGPSPVSYRRIALVKDPRITLNDALVGNQYDERSDNPSAGNWGLNNWYFSKFTKPGDLYYLENRVKIDRAAGQQERISAVIEF